MIFASDLKQFFSITLSFDAIGWVFPYEYLNATYLAKKLLTWAVWPWRRAPHDPSFPRLDAVPACDGQTDGLYGVQCEMQKGKKKVTHIRTNAMYIICACLNIIGYGQIWVWQA